MAEAVSAVGTVLVASARIYDILVFLQVGVYLCHEGRVYLVYRQHRVSVYGVVLYFGGHLQRVFQGLRVVREQRGHLFLRLDVLLLGIAQTVRVVYIGVGGKADKAVVHGAVFFAHKVGVVGGYYLDAVFFG